MKYIRRLALSLCAFTLAAGLTAGPVLATESQGGESVFTETSSENTALPSMGESSSEVVPTPEPPPSSSSSSSEEPPSSSSSSSSSQSSSSSSSEHSSSSSESSGSSSESSSSSSESSGSSSEHSSSSSETPWEDPSSQDSSSSSEDPWSSSESEDPWLPSESESESESPWAGAVVPSTPTPESSSTPRPIATPRPAVERPQVSLNTESSSSEEEDSAEPNYVTFAQLNTRSNSLASTLFFSGVACIAVGVVGLVTILALYLRGRRRQNARDGILEEIHEAETRQKAPEPPVPAPVPPAADADLPVAASLYTEEFSLEGADAYPEDAYGGAEPGYAPQEGGGEYGYPEEDYSEYQDYDGDYQDYEDYGAYQDGSYESAPPAGEDPAYGRHSAGSLGDTRTFDTEEILREALRYTEDDYQ